MDYLPTPTTRDYKDGQAEHRRGGVVQTDTLARAIINGSEVGGGELMPTPKAQDGIKGNLKTSAEREEAGFFVDLPNVAVDLANLGGGQLLPTTTASDWKGPNLLESGSASTNGIATFAAYHSQEYG